MRSSRRWRRDSSESSSPNINPRIAEFDLLASGAPFIGSDTAGSFLYAETLSRDGLGLQEPWAAFLKNVVKVHRLREVTCLYGFTRLEPPPTSAESELDEIQLAVNGADLARNVEWLPAIEQFGEGIFLHIAPAFLKRWLDSSEIVAKAATFRDRERREAERFNRPPIHLGAGILGAPFLVTCLHGGAGPGMRLSALVAEGAHLLQRPRAARSLWDPDLYLDRRGPRHARRIEQHGRAGRRAAGSRDQAARALLERPHMRRARRRERRLPLARRRMSRLPVGS